MQLLAAAQDRRGERGLVDRVGIVLRLEAEAAEGAVVRAALAGAV